MLLLEHKTRGREKCAKICCKIRHNQYSFSNHWYQILKRIKQVISHHCLYSVTYYLERKTKPGLPCIFFSSSFPLHSLTVTCLRIPNHHWFRDSSSQVSFCWMTWVKMFHWERPSSIKMEHLLSMVFLGSELRFWRFNGTWGGSHRSWSLGA